MTRIFCLLLPLLAAAGAGADPVGAAALEAAFSATERLVIEAYFEEQQQRRRDEAGRHGKKPRPEKHQDRQLPPGLARKEALPPGLARQLQRNGTLPPGLARRDLSPELQRRLPARHEGQRRVVVGNDVLLIETATQTILDILFDVAAD